MSFRKAIIQNIKLLNVFLEIFILFTVYSYTLLFTIIIYSFTYKKNVIVGNKKNIIIIIFNTQD